LTPPSQAQKDVDYLLKSKREGIELSEKELDLMQKALELERQKNAMMTYSINPEHSSRIFENIYGGLANLEKQVAEIQNQNVNRGEQNLISKYGVPVLLIAGGLVALYVVAKRFGK